MSGKPKQTGWGGARSGSGRKPINQLCERESKILFKAIRKRAKLEQRTWQEVLLDFVFGKDLATGIPLQLTGKERLTALRLVADLAVAKQSEQTVNVNKTEGPGIYLPERRPDPAQLEVVSGGRT